MMHLFHVPCRLMETALITTIDRDVPLYPIQDLQKKKKLARHSINYKEESWKGVSIGLGWKYHY